MERKRFLVRSVVPHVAEEGLEVRVTTLWTRGYEGVLRLLALGGLESKTWERSAYVVTGAGRHLSGLVE